jgi:hypothetical protein
MKTKIKWFYTCVLVLYKVIFKWGKNPTIVTSESHQRILQHHYKIIEHYQHLLEKEDVYAWYADEYDICNTHRQRILAEINQLLEVAKEKQKKGNDTAMEFFMNDDAESGYYHKGRKDVSQDLTYIIEDIIKRHAI